MLDSETLATHAKRIGEDGYTILEGVIEPEVVGALNADLVRLERLYGVVPAANSFEGERTVRIYNLLAFGKLYEAIPVHENVLPLVERVLDRAVSSRRSRRSASIPARPRSPSTPTIS